MRRFAKYILAACSASSTVLTPLSATAAPPVVTLSTSSAYGGEDTTVTLVATVNTDLIGTQYELSVYDLTTGAKVGACNDDILDTRTRCLFAATFSTGGTHTYRAFMARPGATYPPPAIQAMSGTVDIWWFTLTVTATPGFQLPNQPVVVTASTNADVGPAIHYITIYGDGVLLKECASGTACSVTVSQLILCRSFMAYLSALPNSHTHSPPSAARAWDSTQACWAWGIV